MSTYPTSPDYAPDTRPESAGFNHNYNFRIEFSHCSLLAFHYGRFEGPHTDYKEVAKHNVTTIPATPSLHIYNDNGTHRADLYMNINTDWIRSTSYGLACGDLQYLESVQDHMDYFFPHDRFKTVQYADVSRQTTDQVVFEYRGNFFKALKTSTQSFKNNLISEPHVLKINPDDFSYSKEERAMIGYKVMRYDPTSNTLISGADSRISHPLRIGAQLEMPDPGIWMSTHRQYVLDFYRCHDHEVLLKLEFDPETIAIGNLMDKQPEFTVPTAKILSYDVLTD